MAKYTEVIKHFKRMCQYYSRANGQKNCPICTSYPNCNIGQCRKIAFEQPACFNDVVMSWAAEHPEPVYETWFEYLLRIGVIPENAPAGGEYQWIVESIKHKHISNDIAKSLKLHPKEVQA